MTTRDFCYWLMGSLELNENEGFNEKQTEILKRHLDMVFIHMVNDDGTLKPEAKGWRLGDPISFHPSEIKENC